MKTTIKVITTAAAAHDTPITADLERPEFWFSGGDVGFFVFVGGQGAGFVGHVCGGIFVGGHDLVGENPPHVCGSGHSLQIVK